MSGNKRFTRSGKKSGSDDNAGNFVFSFPGTANPNQSMTFGGSAPSSPIGSPAGFGTAQPPSSPSVPTFGGAAAPSSPSASGNVFVFGAGATSSLPGSPNVGANNTAPSSPNAPLRRNFTDITQTPTSSTFGSTALRRSNSDMGTPSTTFTFGSPANTPSTPSSSTFTFGAGGQNQTPSTGTQPATSTSTFSFGSPAANASTTTTPSSPFTFGNTSAAPSTTTSAPSTSSPAPATFSFGSSASSTTTTTKPASSTATSAFSFGSPAPPAASPSVSNVSFGTSSTAPKTDSTTPSFSLKMPASSTTTTTTSSTPAASLFGSGATTTTSAPTFSFSIPSTDTAKPTTDKKDDKPASSLFSFGAKPTTSAATSTASFSATKPATTTPAAPLTTPSAPNAFSFSTTLENLEKAAKLPPNQIGAALITPSLNALRQNQVVTHTNFRIDNILPSTRYTELPEQARKELDELAQYIHGESQRCDHVKNRAVPKRQETMKEAKHEYEILSYKLDSLSNSLQMQVNAVEELFDLLKEQIRHFNDGQSVLDACKHPGGRSARWLFGYGNDDDYFMTLSTRLATRMEEYKQCLREIEYTTESWTKNHAQSPQDIARIMTSQNQTFLALTNQVAALHETLKMEQDLYTQYRFQAITL